MNPIERALKRAEDIQAANRDLEQMSQPAETQYAVLTFTDAGDVVIHSHGASEECGDHAHKVVPAAEVPDYVQSLRGH